MPHIRKAQAGSDSFGNVWDRDGAVVEVPHEQAEQLLVIDDGQFTLADEPAETPVPDPADDVDKGDEFSEVDPNAPVDEPAASPEPEPLPEVEEKPTPAPAKKTAARKTAASKPQE